MRPDQIDPRFERAAHSHFTRAEHGVSSEPGYMLRNLVPDTLSGRLLALQRAAGNKAVSQLLKGAGPSRASCARVLALQRFSQTGTGVQTNHHGGVKSDYVIETNVVEFHIEAGANSDGKMIQNFLLAMYEARNAIRDGQKRNALVPGYVFMRPAGSQVLKMTMEMLGEALGRGDSLVEARETKEARKKGKIPLENSDDTLDLAVISEHIKYRNALVGVEGVTMSPIGPGVHGGTVDMLAATPAGVDERDAYNTALLQLSPFMSIGVTIELAQLSQIINMIERKMTVLQRLALKLLK